MRNNSMTKLSTLEIRDQLKYYIPFICKNVELKSADPHIHPLSPWAKKRILLKFKDKKAIGFLGQVWYLIVSIPDLCTLTYFENKIRVI